jgi:protein subunit release factor B
MEKKSNRQLVFSITSADVEWQTFRAGGKGGQYQNKTESGVRCIHHPSGARGEARDERSQLLNRRAAWERMAKTKKFQDWCRTEAARRSGQMTPEQRVETAMHPDNIKVEYYNPNDTQ